MGWETGTNASGATRRASGALAGRPDAQAHDRCAVPWCGCMCRSRHEGLHGPEHCLRRGHRGPRCVMGVSGVAGPRFHVNLPTSKNLPIGKIPDSKAHASFLVAASFHNGAMRSARPPSRAATVQARTSLAPSLNAAPPSPRAPSPSRLKKEQHILSEAESHFAQFGFEGASLESIAAAAGISRHNLRKKLCAVTSAPSCGLRWSAPTAPRCSPRR